LEKVTAGDRRRYKVFDRHAGPKGGDLRMLWYLPKARSSCQHLDGLARLSQNSFGMPAILEYHEQREYFVVVMPWVWGTDLKSYLDCRRNGRPRWPGSLETFNLLRRFAHALNSLHQHRNMVHGDLKPENLIYCREPNRLVMIDFGSAWTVERGAQRTPGDGKTDAYASPEQLNHLSLVDFHSDMFSTSVIAYQMFTGDIPYAKMGGRAGITQERATFADTLIPPSQARRDPRPLPPGAWAKIDRVITTGLALDADSRYRTDREWLDALDDIDTDLNRRHLRSNPSRFLQTIIDWMPESWRRKWLD
jgi:serine/threonine protein kinase